MSFFTLRVSPPAHPQTATPANHADSRVFQAYVCLLSHIYPVPMSSCRLAHPPSGGNGGRTSPRRRRERRCWEGRQRA
eukprot:5944627-Pyramimonas_sp.AAC.1